MVKPFSGMLERRFGHRTITHSLLGILLLATAFSPLLLFVPSIWKWLLIGYATHLLLDTANISGIPLLYPNRLQFWLVYNRTWRVPYNSPREFIWLSTICILALALMPFSINGFSPWFHRALGSPHGAVEDYQLWAKDYEVIAMVNGHNLVTGEEIKAEFKVIDALGKQILLVEDLTGRAYSVGLDDNANIQVDRVRIKKGAKLQSSSYRVDLTGRLVSDLIHSLPPANRVQINAVLQMSDIPTPPLLLGEYQRIQKKGDALEIRAATQGDLAPYSSYLIKSGSAMIFAEYSPETNIIAQEPSKAAPPLSSHILTITGLPSLSGLLIEQGQEITEGELIARYIDDSGLELTQLDKQRATDEISSLETSLDLEHLTYQAAITEQKIQLKQQETELEKITYLVTNGAEPRNKKLEAENHLRELKANELKLMSDWTSRKHSLESRLASARVSLAKSENVEEAELKNQWVAAPVSGVVSDVRIVGSSKNGVDLEVVILQLITDLDVSN